MLQCSLVLGKAYFTVLDSFGKGRLKPPQSIPAPWKHCTGNVPRLHPAKVGAGYGWGGDKFMTYRKRGRRQHVHLEGMVWL